MGNIDWKSCRWCGRRVPDEDDCPAPSDYCGHARTFPEIEVGQVWIDRCGQRVRVTCDRRPFAIRGEWRWALSNSVIVNQWGRANPLGPDSPYDLDELVRTAEQEREWVLRDAAIRGMDSMRDSL